MLLMLCFKSSKFARKFDAFKSAAFTTLWVLLVVVELLDDLTRVVVVLLCDEFVCNLIYTKIRLVLRTNIIIG